VLFVCLFHCAGEEGEEMVTAFAAESASERELVLFQLLLKVAAEVIRAEQKQANTSEQNNQLPTEEVPHHADNAGGVTAESGSGDAEPMDESGVESMEFSAAFAEATLPEVDAAAESYANGTLWHSLHCSQRYDRLCVKLVVALCGAPSKATAHTLTAASSRKFELPLVSVLLRIPYLPQSITNLLMHYCSNPGRYDCVSVYAHHMCVRVYARVCLFISCVCESTLFLQYVLLPAFTD
jgi:hypothetical protein